MRPAALSSRLGLCPVCSPLCVAVRAVRLPLCPPAFLLGQRSRGLGLGWLLTSPKRTARDRRQERGTTTAPVLSLLPVLQSSSSSPTCRSFLSFLPVLPSLPVLASLPSVPACLLPSRIAIRALGDGGAHRHAPHCPLLPASVCSPLGVAVHAVRLPLCPPAFPLRQRSWGLGLGWLLTSPRRTDTRDARAPGGGAFEVAQHGVSGRRGATDKAEWGPAGLYLGAF